MPPAPGCPGTGPSSSEVTRAICRVPSTPFSQAPEYILLVHLCRFRVRPIRWGSFLEAHRPPAKSDNRRQALNSVTTNRLTNINVISIGYAFRPHLRSRLTLRGLTLRRNPWTYGESVSHTLYRYSCHHSHFRYLQDPSQVSLHRLTERSATACKPHKSKQTLSFGTWFEPRYIFAAGTLDQ